MVQHRGRHAAAVLDNIDLTIAAQSIVAIIGSSGCGKSTLLNIISGLVTPERGDIILNGIPARNFSDWRSISYMFQEDRLLPWRTALRNVEFSLEAGSMLRSEREARARDALKLVGLENFCRCVSLSTLGRHAQPRRAGPQPGAGALHPADG